jgi:hypothetical protein
MKSTKPKAANHSTRDHTSIKSSHNNVKINMDTKKVKAAMWSEARKEILPLSVGAIALVASSSVNQGMCSSTHAWSKHKLAFS